MSDIARVLLEELAGDPVALERLRELVAVDAEPAAARPAYTVATLAAELGRSERSIRAAISRGELAAVKRGRGWVIAADAVAAWARSPASLGGQTRHSPASSGARAPRSRSGAGPMARALRSR